MHLTVDACLAINLTKFPSLHAIQPKTIRRVLTMFMSRVSVRGYVLMPVSTQIIFAFTFVAVWLRNTEHVFAQPAPPVAVETDPLKLQVDGVLSSADSLLQNSAWDEVIAVSSQAIDLDPKSVRAYVLRGKAWNGKSDYDNAIKDFDLAVQQTARDQASTAYRADAYAQRSHSLYQQGKYLPAIDSAYLGTLEKSDHLPAHLNRAVAYVARNEHDKAINSLNRVIQIEPKSAEAYSLRGFVYAVKGNPGQSILDQTKSLELKPGNAIALERRASASFTTKDFVAATRDLEQALQINPTLPEALCDRAMVLAMNGNMAGAIADVDAAINANPKFAQAHILRGQAMKSQKNIDEAINSFDQAILASENAIAYFERASAYLEKKDFEKSSQDFTRAIELDSKMLNAYKGRILAYVKLGMTEDAKADRLKVKELTPVAPAPSTSKEKTPEPKPPRFIVTPKPVEADKLASAIASAKEIDRLVALNHVKFRVKSNAKTTDSQFVRRVYLDLAGTIPDIQQVGRFLVSKDPDKRSRLIDELLGGEGYSSHFFNYWADILRYKDQLSNDVRGEPYRQWIKQSLAENKPWNRFVYEMVTAKGVAWKNPATGYVQRDPGMPLDAMNNTTRIFLGTRIGCAQCHNHPFDRWTQKEFYQMAAFTFGTRTNASGEDKRYWSENPNDRLHEDYEAIEQEEEDRRQNSYRFDRMISVNMMVVNDVQDTKIRLPKDYAYDDAKPDEVVEPKTLFGSPADVRKGETPRQAFARWLVSKENPRFAKTIANRLWKQLFGIGQIEPVDDMMDSTVAENPDLMNFLESEMKRLDFDMKEYLRILMNTETYQCEATSSEISLGQPYHFPGPILRRMTAEQVWDSFLTLSVSPVEYREPPSLIRSKIINLDLTNATAKEILEAERKAAEVDAMVSQWQSKYLFKGTLLARASELPSPVPANHFLRMFGQSDRELISASSTNGSVPQILLMFNGPISHMLLEKNSSIYNNITRTSSVSGGIRSVFLTILGRVPDAEELEISAKEVKQDGPIGYGNIVWSLVNTREFLFIQ